MTCAGVGTAGLLGAGCVRPGGHITVFPSAFQEFPQFRAILVENRYHRAPVRRLDQRGFAAVRGLYGTCIDRIRTRSFRYCCVSLTSSRTFHSYPFWPLTGWSV